MNRAVVSSIVGLLFVAAPAVAQSRLYEQTVPVQAGGTLSLHSTRGTVRLTSWDQPRVEVRARIQSDANILSDRDRRAVDETSIDVVTSGNSVMIRTNYDKLNNASWLFGNWGSWGGVPSVHYEIRAPRRLDLRLQIDRSRTVLTGFEGRVDIDADRSEIDATDLVGPVRAVIDRGGGSRFRNISGSVDLEADRTNLVIDMAKLDGPSRIEIDRGDVDLSLARGSGFNLDTSLSKRANIIANVPGQTFKLDRRNPSGQVNGGGPRLSIRADRSQIRLRS